jgi:hypothetical protein
MSDDALICIWRHPVDRTWIVIECHGWGERDEDEWRDRLAIEIALDLTPALLHRIQEVRTRELAEFSQSDRLPGYRELLLNSVTSSIEQPHP